MSVEVIITSLINAIIFVVLEIYVAKKILDKKVNLKSFSNICIMMLYIIFLISSTFMTDKFLTTSSLCIILILLYKKLFDYDWIKSISLAITIYIMTFTSEIIIGSILSILSTLLNLKIVEIITGSVILNLMVAIPMILMTKFWSKKITKVIGFIENKGEGIFVVVFASLVLIFSIILSRYDIRNWMFNFEFYINILIFIIVLVILVVIVKQYNDNAVFFSKYKEIVDYSNLTGKVLEEYRIKTHEYKNQLAIIKSMLNEKDKELNEYVDNLIEKNKNHKYSWINQVKYITLPALKGLLNYKITEFNELKINTHIVVSKEMENVTFNNLTTKDKDDLYSIIGVYLDNAKEAAIESENKKIDIDITFVDNNIKITIANSYKGTIDENKLDNYRYSTKGKDRGIGLYLVKKVIKKNDIFSVYRKITNKFYIQILYIRIEKKEKIK